MEAFHLFSKFNFLLVFENNKLVKHFFTLIKLRLLFLNYSSEFNNIPLFEFFEVPNQHWEIVRKILSRFP